MKHTPGPWKLCHHLQSKKQDDACPCGFPGDIWGSDGEHVVCTMGPMHIPGEESCSPPGYPRNIELANAKLIAAAPMMFDLLQRLTDSKVIQSADYIGYSESWKSACDFISNYSKDLE